MKVNELRIGNILNAIATNGIETINFYEIIVNEILTDGIREEKGLKFPYHTLVGTPLTEEWFLKFGFDKVNNEDDIFYQKGYIRVSRDTYESQLFYFRKRVPSQIWKDNVVASIKYVHELQNLTYAITKEELKL